MGLLGSRVSSNPWRRVSRTTVQFFLDASQVVSLMLVESQRFSSKVET